jgi:hypothetical protein
MSHNWNPKSSQSANRRNVLHIKFCTEMWIIRTVSLFRLLSPEYCHCKLPGSADFAFRESGHRSKAQKSFALNPMHVYSLQRQCLKLGNDHVHIFSNSLIILSFDTIWSEILKSLLNKVRLTKKQEQATGAMWYQPIPQHNFFKIRFNIKLPLIPRPLMLSDLQLIQVKYCSMRATCIDHSSTLIWSPSITKPVLQEVQIMKFLIMQRSSLSCHLFFHIDVIPWNLSSVQSMSILYGKTRFHTNSG